MEKTRQEGNICRNRDKKAILRNEGKKAIFGETRAKRQYGETKAKKQYLGKPRQKHNTEKPKQIWCTIKFSCTAPQGQSRPAPSRPTQSLFCWFLVISQKKNRKKMCLWRIYVKTKKNSVVFIRTIVKNKPKFFCY